MNLEIINIAADTKNNRNIKNHTHYSKLKNSVCGDKIQIKLIIRNNNIIDFCYQTESCIYCQASASLLSKVSINSKKDEINQLCKDVNSYFHKNEKINNKNLKLFSKLFKEENMSRKECILLPFKTLMNIVKS
tara:strand:+ start:541 stop:939 length:399 start_codon:yes stop_codon:yes gene_type:complete